MIQTLKNHKWAIILALIVSVIVGCPQLYLRYDLGQNSQGIEFFGINDEIAWSARAREAYDGHPSLGNAYFREGKSDPYVIQPLGAAIIGTAGRILGLNINNALLLSRILLSFLVFLLVYSFIYLFSQKKLIALSISSFLILANSFFSKSAILKLLAGLSPTVNFVNYTRPVNPLMTHFFFFGFLLFFWLFYEKKRRKFGILSAVFLGLSFYDYFYTWTFLFSFLGVLCLIFILRKNWPDFKRVILVALGAVLIAVPYFYNLYRITTFPTYDEVRQRVGLIENQTLVVGTMAPILLGIFLLFFRRQWKERYYFGLALLIAPLVVLNQQLITGLVMQSGHYHWYFHMPLAIIFLLIMLFDRIPFKKTLAILIIIVSLGAGVFIQKSSYAAHREQILEWQRYGSVMDWLSKNAEKDEVVFSDSKAAFMIVIYTPLNVFYHSNAGGCLSTTHERLLDALFLYYRLSGVGINDAEKVFAEDRGYISEKLYGTYFRDSTGEDQYLPEDLLAEFTKKYQESLNVSNSDFFGEMLIKYGVRYAVWDKEFNPDWLLDQYLFLEKVAEMNDFIIYRII